MKNAIRSNEQTSLEVIVYSQLLLHDLCQVWAFASRQSQHPLYWKRGRLQKIPEILESLLEGVDHLSLAHIGEGISYVAQLRDHSSPAKSFEGSSRNHGGTSRDLRESRSAMTEGKV